VNDVTPRRSLDDLEARVGRRLAALLDDAGGPMDATVTARLRFAREQAVARAAAARRPAAVSDGAVRAGRMVLAGVPGGDDTGRSERWLRLGTLIPIALLALGLLAVQEWHQRTQITAVAEVDLALLGDDLPPTAYADPGFLEFLKQPKEWIEERSASPEALEPAEVPEASPDAEVSESVAAPVDRLGGDATTGEPTKP
jgi:hypothetical protein